MPRRIARMLATDEAVGSEELEAAISYLNKKLQEADARKEPVPFLSYRNKVIFEATLQFRREGSC